MKNKRSYRQYCGIAKALDVVGERWTLLIARNLLVGGLRYKELLETLPGITTNLLAQRLKELSAAGLLVQRTLPAPGHGVVYELTERGRELEPVLLALGRFGAPYLDTPKRGDRTHVRWALVSLKRRYRGLAHARSPSLALCVDDTHHYRLRLDSSRLEIEEAPARGDEDVRVRMTNAVFRALFFGHVSVRALIQRNAIELDGSPQALFDLVESTCSDP
jgi:DNA-binding HxlR family transcriptional regulator